MRSLIILLSLIATSVLAEPMQAFRFEDPSQEESFKRLSHEIRCLVCQNQSIGDSNADLAKDLRQEIYNMMQDGRTEQQIVDFLVERYGDFVLYDPPMKPTTWLLWFGPLLMFGVACYMAMRFIKGMQQDDAAATDDDGRLAELRDEVEHIREGDR